MTFSPTPTIDLQCNRAAFVGDVTILDNTVLHLSEPFTKTWRIKNVGTCSWSTDYKLAFISGDKMNSPDFVPLPVTVGSGQTIDISVNLIAPNTPGNYEGYWQLLSGDGKVFPASPSVNGPLWAKIRVIAPAFNTLTPTSVATSGTPLEATPIAQATSSLDVTYDFVGNACVAQWESTDGTLPCPGLDGDIHGFVKINNQAKLEDGTTASLPTLLTFPSSSSNGYIQGTYPEIQIQAGDHIQTTVSCEQGATSCSVLFSIHYLDSSGTSHDLWTLGEFYDGEYFNLDLDLSSLAGQTIRFVLNVSSLGSSAGDRALWVAPRIVHFPVVVPTAIDTSTPTMPAPTTTPTQTATATPPVPTATSTMSPTPTPAAGNQNPLTSIQQIIDSIASFFQRLFGGK
jgi:hypothetical protein